MKYEGIRPRQLSKEKILVLITGFCNLDCDKSFVEPLKEIFPKVIRYDFLTRFKELGSCSMNKELMELFLRELPYYVLILTYEHEIYRSTIESMNRAGALTIGWFFDDEVRFDDYSKWLGSILSYSVTLHKESYYSCLNLGIKALLSNTGVNSRSFHPYDYDQIYDVSFLGYPYPHRISFFQKLKERGIRVNLFGKAGGKYLRTEDLAKVYSKSKINLNFCATYAGDHIRQIKGHIYHITMSGGFGLTDYAPNLEDYFEIGKEIVVFYGVEDAVKKIKYYLEHEDEREKIARAGRERCLRDHTWNKRFREVFKKIEELESQRKSEESGNALSAIRKNEWPPCWPGNSYDEKRKYQLSVALFYTRWGIKFFKKRQFALSFSEFVYAVSEYPFIIFSWCFSFPKAKLKSIIPLKLKNIIKTGLRNYSQKKEHRKLKVKLDKLILPRNAIYNSFDGVLDFLKSCTISNGSVVYTPRVKQGCLYNDIYALLLMGLLPNKDSKGTKICNSLVRKILLSQNADGLFGNKIINNEIAEVEDWWGWRHLTVHAINALAIFDIKAEKPFRILEPLYGKGDGEKWIASLDWANNACNESNKIMNYGVMLQYDRDFHGIKEAGEALDEIFEWLDLNQDLKTGLWGNGSFQTPHELSIGVQTAYHIWILYFFDKRPIQHIEQSIDSCLKTQNRLGGFGVSLNSSACEDIDSIDPLCRLYFMTDYRKRDIAKALQKAIPWILANQNEDGGFVFKRFEPFRYGHELMTTGPNESGIFPTWFRTLSLAYISKVIPEHPLFAKIKFQFPNCPGYQFWKE